MYTINIRMYIQGRQPALECNNVLGGKILTIHYPMNNLKNFSDALSIYSLKLKSLEFLKHIGGGDK